MTAVSAIVVSQNGGPLLGACLRALRTALDGIDAELIVVDNGSAGIVFMGRSGGAASGNECSGARFGLVLDGSAVPVLGRNDCPVQDQRGGV